MSRLFIIIVIALFFITGYDLQAQEAEYNYKQQFTIDDGLPSNECHDIVQDSKGYIWIATDRGLVRYDGYSFRNYGVVDGLADISCLNLFLDNNDNIWINTISKNIYRYEQSKDKIIPYEYNDVVQAHGKQSSIIQNIIIDKDFNTYINFIGNNAVKIAPNGDTELIYSDNPYQGYILQHIDNYLLRSSDNFNSDNNLKPLSDSYVRLNKGDLIERQNISYQRRLIPIPINKNWTRAGRSCAFKLNTETVLLSSHGYNSLIIGDSICDVKSGQIINDITALPNGGFYTAQMNKIGVKYFDSIEGFKNDEYQNIHKDFSVSSIYISDDGTIWVSTLEDGMFILRNQFIKTIPLGQKKLQKISDVEISADGELYFISNDRTLSSYNLASGKINTRMSSESEITDLVHIGNQDAFALGGINSSIYKENEELKWLYRTDRNKHINISSNSNRITYEFHDELLLFSPNGLVSYFLPSAKEQYNTELSAFNRSIRIITACKYQQDHYLLGSAKGLYLLKDNQYYQLDTLFPVFSQRVNTIRKKNDSYVIGTQGAGVLIWDGQDQLQQYTSGNGLISDNIEEISINNDNGQIYVSTYSGLSMMTPTDTGYKIRSYTTAHGLPSNEVFDTEYYGDTLYIATGKGLASVNMYELSQAPRTLPLIEKIITRDSSYVNITNIGQLDYSDNTLDIQYKTIDFDLSGDINYRYNINDSKWTETQKTSLQLVELSPRAYQIELQSQNKNDEWSDSTLVQFSISPPWYQWWSTRAMVLLILFALAYFIYRNRIKRIESKASIEKEMRDLEKSALAAQMNPHFIFNCLNSIQHYIMKNDKESAMDYLGTFASLIRGSLRSSAESSISIAAEIKMLDNYLALEQLRLDHSFEYAIKTDKTLDTFQTFIPPMLIQPFVENAVIHGMKDKKDGGKITIAFSKNSDHLHVSVQDNGSRQVSKNPEHKSYGTSITQKRLAIINDLSESDIKVAPEYTEVGTAIRLKIKIQEPELPPKRPLRN